MLSVGVGKHVARHIPIYLTLGAAALLPLFVYLSIPELSEQRLLTTLYLSLLGDSQAEHAGKHLLAMGLGMAHGFILQMSRNSAERRE